MQLSKRVIINSSLGIVVVAAIVGAYFVINPPAASSSSAATQLTSTVQQGTVSNTITASGSIAPVNEVTASFPASGTVASVDVDTRPNRHGRRKRSERSTPPHCNAR